MRTRWLLGLWLMLGLPACNVIDDPGSDDDSLGDDDDSFATSCEFQDSAAATIDVAERYGYQFQFTHTSIIRAQLTDGPAPPIYQVFMEQDGCRYEKRHFGFCDPPCGPEETCNVDDACEPYPLEVGAGTMTISGLQVPVTVEPESWAVGRYYGPGDLPEDLFAAQDPIAVSFAGDELPAFTIEAWGVEALETPLSAEESRLIEGQDNVLTWTPGPDPDACVEVVINGVNEAHGMPLHDIITCVGPDDGEVVVPQALIDEIFSGEGLPESCTHRDCPQSVLTRFTRGRTTVDGVTMDLLVRNSVYFAGGVAMGK